MSHPFIAAVADGLAERDIATLSISLYGRGAASAPIRQKSLRPPSALQSPKRRACFPALLFSQEESRLAAA
jgi:hypothetical protein